MNLIEFIFVKPTEFETFFVWDRVWNWLVHESDRYYVHNRPFNFIPLDLPLWNWLCSLSKSSGSWSMNWAIDYCFICLLKTGPWKIWLIAVYPVCIRKQQKNQENNRSNPNYVQSYDRKFHKYFLKVVCRLNIFILHMNFYFSLHGPWVFWAL